MELDTILLTEDKIMSEVKVDGRSVDEKEFKSIKEETSQDKSKLLKEVSPGEYKTLTKMQG